jgi:two-component sensor histidine kinase
VQSFSTALSNRIEAMAQTHTLLAEGKWVGTSLRRVIEDDVVPTTLEQAGRLTIRGDDIFLSPLEALALSMVLHEMMTNAVRHGALSVPQGAVSVEWNIDEQAGSIVVCWNESGVPQSGLAGDMGTGIGLITRTIEEDLHGSVEFNFAPDGLRCELRLPVGDASLR